MLLLLGSCLAGGVQAGEMDWPGWRGDGTGIAPNGNPPLAWGPREGVLWKSVIPGKGFSSPVVRDGRVFVTTAMQGAERAQARRQVWLTLGALALLAAVAYRFDLRHRELRETSLHPGEPSPPTGRWARVLPALTLLLPLGALAVAEWLVNGEGYLASRWVAGSLARGWLVSGTACALGLSAALWIARRHTGLLRAVAGVCTPLLIYFLYAIPDPRLFTLESSRIAESALAAAGATLGLLSRGRSRVAGALATIALVLGSGGFVVYLHLGGLPSLASLRFKIVAGLLAGLVLWVGTRSLSATKAAPGLPDATPGGVRLPAAVALLLLALVVTHFYAAHFLLPSKGTMRTALCLDLSSGRCLWSHGFSAEEEPLIAGNSYATPTPATDGDRLCTYFGNAGAMGLSRDGERLWVNRDLPLPTDYGAGTSPVVGFGLMYLACDNKKESYVAALDIASGETRWRRSRESGEGFSTPVLSRIEGVDQLLVNGGRLFAAYDPTSGRELWSARLGHSDETTPSPVLEGEVAYLGRSYANNRLSAYRLHANSPPTLLWTTPEKVVGYASPLVAGGFLYVITNEGVARCLRTSTGEVVWSRPLGGTYTGSPVMAGHRVYFLSSEGEVTVLAEGSSGRVLARNSIGEPSVGSLAVAGDRLLLRTVGHLWCLGGGSAAGR
ncbi:MAG TPA: hypothetical protein DCM86_01605 [Verrucomicrobiales bacterium]|nr:hypothetical protein [Verrucomicrobiales bacterium]